MCACASAACNGATRSMHRPTVFLKTLEQFRGFFAAVANGAGPYQGLVARDGALNPPAGADDRAVVALAHAHADFGEAELCGLAHQVHCDGAGEGDRALSPAGHEVFVFEAEVGADG